MSKKKSSAAVTPPANGAKKSSAAAAKNAARQRRRLLLGLGAVPVLAFGGVAIHRHDVQNRERHDLSVVGGGEPVVVQVHDPSCPMCRRLMSNTLAALEGRDDILYRVADLTTPEGAELGGRYGVGKVTLLLFDARGRHVDTVRGVTPPEELVDRFEARFGAGAGNTPS